MDNTFLLIIEIIGTIAFAVSGIRMAQLKQFDWFGAYIVGLVTAIGGGTLRDLLLGTTPFWMLNGWYLAVTGVALFAVILFGKIIDKMPRTMFLFDSIGLALFVVIGIQKSLAFGFPIWVGIFNGTLTGAFGGVIRDILVNVEPLVFRKDIYATACIAGGIIYWITLCIDENGILAQSLCAISVIAIRILADHYNWSLPTMPSWGGNDNNKQ